MIVNACRCSDGMWNMGTLALWRYRGRHRPFPGIAGLAGLLMGATMLGLLAVPACGQSTAHKQAPVFETDPTRLVGCGYDRNADLLDPSVVARRLKAAHFNATSVGLFGHDSADPRDLAAAENGSHPDRRPSPPAAGVSFENDPTRLVGCGFDRNGDLLNPNEVARALKAAHLNATSVGFFGHDSADPHDLDAVRRWLTARTTAGRL